MKNIKKFIISILLACVSFFSFVIASFNVSYSLTANAESIEEFEGNDVLKDLENSLIDGENFSLKNYNFSNFKSTKVISFLEYGYSFYTNLQTDFGLYVYVYNPKGLNFVGSELNSISFKIGENESDQYEKYNLRLLDVSNQTNYERLFYKLKVELTNSQKEDILSRLNSTERVYSVSEVELQEDGQTNATLIPAEGIYKYSGYMKGLGSVSTAENTLACTNEKLETLELEAHQAVFRPEGTNGKNNYTQDSLHSVYFSVSNEFIRKYGEMAAVHARWLDAVIKPALVTGNQDALSAIEKYVGTEIETTDDI